MQFKLAGLVALVAASAVQAQSTVTGAQLCASAGLCIKDTSGNYCYDDVISNLQMAQTATDAATIQKYLCTECLREIILWFEANPTTSAAAAAQFQSLTPQLDQLCGANFLPTSPAPAPVPISPAPVPISPAPVPVSPAPVPVSPAPAVATPAKSSASTSKFSLGAALVGGAALAALML